MSETFKFKNLVNKKERHKISIEEGIPEAPRLSDFGAIYENVSSTQEDQSFKGSITDSPTSLQTKTQTQEEKETENKYFLCSEFDSNKEQLPYALSSLEIEKVNVNKFSNFTALNNESAFNNTETDDNPVLDNSNTISSKFCNLQINEAEGIDCSEVIKYSDLSSTVNVLIKEMEEPSAPLVSDEKYFIQSDSVGNLYSSNKNRESVDIKKYDFSLNLEDFVVPFTDEKLAEFYFNSELQETINCFDTTLYELNEKLNEDDYFYKLLLEYIQSKNNLRRNIEKIQSLQKRLHTCASTLWTVSEVTKVKDNVVCSDGNSVNFVVKHTKASFNQHNFEEFTYLLDKIKCAIFETIPHDLFIGSFLKLKIEYYLYCLLTSCSEFTNLTAESLVTISLPALNPYSQQCLLNLKQAINTLFIFQRRGQNFDADSSFLEESRQWLTDLVSVLLRSATWKDHIFILKHVMRCSGGVVEWAAPFIQLPLSIAPDDPFNNSQINHILTIMHIFLTQTAKDEEFISNKNTELRNDSNPWMVVDSDGEIEGDTNQNFFLLKENELVSILNQIPFEYLFKAILYYPRSRVVSGFLTANYMLKLLSFSTDFIKILFNGLKLYSLGRYKQFTKRLGRLISHTVHYVTEILMKYKSQNIPQNEILRIQAEYDNFFFKSTKFIYSAKKHGSWQFLASLPYHMASANAIFKVYAILQLNDSQDDGVVNINFSYFEEKFVQLPEEEQCYLLTTLTNMVLAREVTEITFIKNVLLQLFFIGFISSQTMDQSYKSVKNLLHSICLSHSSLISEVLGMQNDAFLSNSIQDEKPSIHLWLNLPLQMWKPHKADLEILFEWLLEPSQNLPYELAKIILQSLNYGIKQGELFMEPETHREIAIMLMKASSKLLSENDQGYIKNLSNLVRPQNSEQTVCDWIWAVLLKLRLHLLDKTEASLYNYFNNLEVHLQCIPEAEADIDLYQLLLKKHSIAYFVALMTTTLGHSVPIICNRGFEFVEVLFSEGKYDHGIACLEFMTLLFLECGDSLYTSEKFISLLNQLIVADKTYVQMAKQLISNNTPGLVLKSAECMIQNQLNCCRALHFEKFSECVKLWIISLTKVPFWNQEFGALYLLDRLLQNAFLNYTATEVIKSILHTVIKEAKPSIETKSSFSPLVGWMQSKSSTISLLPKGFNGDVPWLSYFVIHMEFECFEKENCLWIELLKELIASSNKKTDVDNSLKKVCNHLGIPVRSSNTLAIYKWSYQILNTDISHPLIPLLWQSFFSLYFFKVPGTTDRGSAGVKFFDGVLNQRLFKQLTQKLTETCDHFNSLSKQVEEGKEGNRFWKLQELFQTYSLWMIDSRLHEANFLLYTLPPKYNIELLRLLFQGQNNPWTHFIEYENIEQNFKDCSLNWSKIKHRFQIEKIKTNSFKTEKSIEEKINKRFNTYETPLPAPVIKLKNYSFSRISPDVVIRSENMINYVEPLMNNLSQYGEDYTLLVNVNSSLCRDMQDLFPRLFVTSETQKILSRNCDGTIKTLYNSTLECPCSGPAIVTFKYEESKLNEAVFLQLTKCQKSFDENIEKSMSSFPSHLSTSIFEIDIAIEELKTEYHLANSRKDTNEVINKLKKTGVNLLYEFIKKWSVNVAHVPFLVRACDGYIDALGKTFLENNPEEVDRVLQIILNKEIYGEKLIKFFSPNLSSNEDFIKQYSCALESNSPRFLVLTKFDLERFLHEKEPKFSIRSSLISSICRGLTLRSCESDKSEENHQILRILNEHLNILLTYDFPEHYGEVLKFLLEASQNQTVPTSSWYTFLKALNFDLSFLTEEKQLGQKRFETTLSLKKLKYYFVKYASSPKISLEIIRGTITMLASNFRNERSKAGICGLYKKYRQYVEPIFIFFGMLSYSCVARTLELDAGSLSAKITQQLWPLLCDLYSPWLIPYRNANEHHKIFAEEERGKSFDTAILLPWTTDDLVHASFCVSVFVESVRFILDALPGFNNALSYVWHFYVNNFAHLQVKDHILNVVHGGFLSLPWEKYSPNLQDVELMLKVVNEFLPLSHNFLGNILINIKWTELVHYYIAAYDNEVTTKLHICLLHLFVKLSLEPSLKENEKVTLLLNEANDFAWHLIDSCNYSVVLNWFVARCDPRIILMDERLEYYKLDSTIFRLLQASAGYISSAKFFHSTTETKRLAFIKACVKWLIMSNRKFKSKDSPLFREALFTMIDVMNSVITETTPLSEQKHEATVLLKEFLSIFTDPELSSVVEHTISDWLSKRQSRIIIIGLLNAAGNSLETPEVYGSILELTLETYFSFVGNSDWSEVTSTITLPSTNKKCYKILVEKKYFLTLYAQLLKETHLAEELPSAKLLLNDLLPQLKELKLSDSLEPKFLLLINLFLKLIESEIKRHNRAGMSCLAQFYSLLCIYINQKENGFLSLVGLSKPFISNRFKLTCLGVINGIAIFLKKNHPECLDIIDFKTIQSLESVEKNKAFQDVIEYASYTKIAIEKISTIDDIVQFVVDLCSKLFNKSYLK